MSLLVDRVGVVSYLQTMIIMIIGFYRDVMRKGCRMKRVKERMLDKGSIVCLTFKKKTFFIFT